MQAYRASQMAFKISEINLNKPLCLYNKPHGQKLCSKPIFWEANVIRFKLLVVWPSGEGCAAVLLNLNRLNLCTPDVRKPFDVIKRRRTTTVTRLWQVNCYRWTAAERQKMSSCQNDRQRTSSRKNSNYWRPLYSCVGTPETRCDKVERERGSESIILFVLVWNVWSWRSLTLVTRSLAAQRAEI